MLRQNTPLEFLLVLVPLLLNRVKLNSKTSNKPPSADPNQKKSSNRGKSARKPGAQKGHKGRTLEEFDRWVRVQLTHSALLHVDETRINVNGNLHGLLCVLSLCIFQQDKLE